MQALPPLRLVSVLRFCVVLVEKLPLLAPSCAEPVYATYAIYATNVSTSWHDSAVDTYQSFVSGIRAIFRFILFNLCVAY